MRTASCKTVLRRPQPREDYVVRIYRRGPSDERVLVGTIEKVGRPKLAFHTFDDLWRILTRRRPEAASRRET